MWVCCKQRSLEAFRNQACPVEARFKTETCRLQICSQDSWQSKFSTEWNTVRGNLAYGRQRESWQINQNTTMWHDGESMLAMRTEILSFRFKISYNIECFYSLYIKGTRNEDLFLKYPHFNNLQNLNIGILLILFFSVIEVCFIVLGMY